MASNIKIKIDFYVTHYVQTSDDHTKFLLFYYFYYFTIFTILLFYYFTILLFYYFTIFTILLFLLFLLFYYFNYFYFFSIIMIPCNCKLVSFFCKLFIKPLKNYIKDIIVRFQKVQVVFTLSSFVDNTVKVINMCKYISNSSAVPGGGSPGGGASFPPLKTKKEPEKY